MLVLSKSQDTAEDMLWVIVLQVVLIITMAGGHLRQLGNDARNQDTDQEQLKNQGNILPAMLICYSFNPSEHFH